MVFRIATLFLAMAVLTVLPNGLPPLSGTPSTSFNVFEIGPETDLPTVLSNAPNQSIIRLAPGIYPVVPALIFNGGLGGINFFSKTNVTIEGAGESTIIDGTSAIGEVFHMTNCSGITLRGITMRGRVETNYTLISGVGHVWGSFSIYASEKITVEQCRFVDGHDHGIHDVGAQPYWDVISTNDIVIRNNYFENFGSARTNEVVRVDGTAIVPTGWLVEGNEFRDCLRCVEPYSESDSNPNLFYNCVIRSNTMINTLDAAILTAGSTNGQNLLIDGNYIYNDPGYARRGTNVHADFTGINLNAGHGHIIRGNTILEAGYIGISIGGGALSTGDILMESNVIESIDAQSQGFGIFVHASDGLPVPNVTIRYNSIRQTMNYGMYLRSLRNSLIESNSIDDVCIVPGAAIKLDTDDFGYNSNVVIRANRITRSSGNMLSGIHVTAGNKYIRVEDNCIEGVLDTPIDNEAGSEMVFASRGALCAATPVSIRINEWMADNEGIIVDPWDGKSCDWFELKNYGTSAINLSGYYLTDALSDKYKFQIPMQRPYVIPAQGLLVIWADGEEGQNDLSSDIHAGFKLAKSSGDIGVFAGDGTQIDAVTYGAQTNNVSEGFSPTNPAVRIFMLAPSPGFENSTVPPPRINSLSVTDSTLTVHFDTESGSTYRLEGNSQLGNSGWATLVDGVEAVAPATTVSVTLGASRYQFFRVVLIRQ